MSFFKKIFGGKESNNLPRFDDEPNVKFGRYSDSFKNETQVEKWRVALDLFKKKDYVDAYRHFFSYLRDEDANNVKITEENNALHFEVLQGSKKISGTCDSKHVQAEVKVVKSNKLNVAFMRKLMEKNYNLKYSRFALAEDDTVYMKFSTTAEAGSPEKLYYALKEVAIQADKLDDLLINEFSTLEPVDNTHILPLSKEESATKIKWLRKYIHASKSIIDNIGISKNEGDKAYIMLALVFKLDYLISPEGKVMDLLEKAQTAYFRQMDNKSPQEKIEEMMESFDEIIEMSDDQLKEELYVTTSTFGLGTPTGHNIISDMIENTGKNLKGAIDNRNYDIAKAIAEYISGYSLFFYGMQKPTKRFFEFLMKILNYEFYQELGFQKNYFEGGELNKSVIKKRIAEINESFKVEFPNIAINAANFNYESRAHFAYSFLKEIQKLPYPKN